MISKTLTAASTKPIILGILRQGRGYGYMIIQRIKKLSGGKMEWSDGMLYPVLHRMEKEGLIRSEWILSDESRPRKYYEITQTGKEALVVERRQWEQVTRLLATIWEVNPAKS